MFRDGLHSETDPINEWNQFGSFGHYNQKLVVQIRFSDVEKQRFNNWKLTIQKKLTWLWPNEQTLDQQVKSTKIDQFTTLDQMVTNRSEKNSQNRSEIDQLEPNLVLISANLDPAPRTASKNKQCHQS